MLEGVEIDQYIWGILHSVANMAVDEVCLDQSGGWKPATSFTSSQINSDHTSPAINKRPSMSDMPSAAKAANGNHFLAVADIPTAYQQQHMSLSSPSSHRHHHQINSQQQQQPPAAGVSEQLSDPSFPRSTTPDFIKCLSHISQSFDSPPSLSTASSTGPGSNGSGGQPATDDRNPPGAQGQGQSLLSASPASIPPQSSLSPTGNYCNTYAAESAGASAACITVNSREQDCNNAATATASTNIATRLLSPSQRHQHQQQVGEGRGYPDSQGQLTFDPLSVIAGDNVQSDLNVSDLNLDLMVTLLLKKYFVERKRSGYACITQRYALLQLRIILQTIWTKPSYTELIKYIIVAVVIMQFYDVVSVMYLQLLPDNIGDLDVAALLGDDHATADANDVIVADGTTTDLLSIF